MPFLLVSEKLLLFGVWLLFFSLFSSASGIGIGTAFVGVFAAVLFWRDLTQLPRLPLFRPIVVLCLALILSVVFAKGDQFSKPLLKLRYFGVYFLLIFTFARFAQLRTQLALAAVGLSVLLCVVAVLQFLGIFDPLLALGMIKVPLPSIPQADGTFFHARGFLHHHNPFGFTSLMLYHLLLGQALTAREPKSRLQFWIGVGAILVGILASCSRGSWLALTGSTLIVGFTVARTHWRAFVGIGVAVLLIVLALGAPLRQRLSHMQPSQNHERIRLWEICMEMFKESPILGHGYHRGFELQQQRFMTPEELSTPTFPKDPHSAFFDLLGTTGIFGFGAFVAFLLAALLSYWRTLRRVGKQLAPADQGFLLGGLGAFLCFIVGAAFDSHFYHTQTLVGMLFCLALGQSVVYRCEAQSRNAAFKDRQGR